MRAVLMGAIVLAPFTLAQTREAAIGHQFAKEMEREYRILPDPQVKGYAGHLAGLVAQAASLNVPVSLKILENGEVRVFAFPGGFVYISTGLIGRAESEAELAGGRRQRLRSKSVGHGMFRLDSQPSNTACIA